MIGNKLDKLCFNDNDVSDISEDIKHNHTFYASHIHGGNQFLDRLE